MKKNLVELLQKTSSTTTETKAPDSLAGQLNQFDKADQIMTKISNQTVEVKRDKIEYVTYAIPESFVQLLNETIKKSMRQEISINKSEIIRLGIQMVSELSFEELVDRLNAVKLTKGRPKII